MTTVPDGHIVVAVGFVIPLLKDDDRERLPAGKRIKCTNRLVQSNNLETKNTTISRVGDMIVVCACHVAIRVHRAARSVGGVDVVPSEPRIVEDTLLQSEVAVERDGESRARESEKCSCSEHRENAEV